MLFTRPRFTRVFRGLIKSFVDIQSVVAREVVSFSAGLYSCLFKCSDMLLSLASTAGDTWPTENLSCSVWVQRRERGK